MGELTKAQHELLKAIADGSLTGWHTTVRRLHFKHLSNALQLRLMGLLAWSDIEPRIKITEAGLTALQRQGGEHVV